MKRVSKQIRAAAAACAAALLLGACQSPAAPTQGAADSTQGASETVQSQEEPATTSGVAQAGGLIDGTYTASAQGKNGPVTVSVSFSDSKITSVEVGEHSETQGLYEPVFSQLPEEIVANQTVNVDVIAGSTYSSNALLEAVKDCITQAGGEVSAFMEPVEKETSTEVRELST